MRIAAALPIRLCALYFAASACSGDPAHPDAIDDFVEASGCADDAGTCGRARGSIGSGSTFECMTEEQAARYDDPLTSVVEAFENDLFFPQETEAIAGAAELKALGRLPRTWACTRAEPGELFELLGGSTTEDGSGLRLDPSGHDDFYPTMIQRVQLADRNYSVIPVVGKNELDSIFMDLEIARDPDKGQILIEVAIVPTPGERHRVEGIQIESGAAEAVAYREGGVWSTDANSTSTDGLALLVNVNSAENLGAQVDAHYSDLRDSESRSIRLDDLHSITGGVTYLAMTPDEL